MVYIWQVPWILVLSLIFPRFVLSYVPDAGNPGPREGVESAQGVRGGREWEWGGIEQGWDPARRAKSLAFLGRDEEGEEEEKKNENDENDKNENEVENETEEKKPPQLNVSDKNSPYALIDKYFPERESYFYQNKNSFVQQYARELKPSIGNLDPEEVWLVKDNLLVLRGGSTPDRNGIDDVWEPLDDFQAPYREPVLPPPDFDPETLDLGVGVPVHEIDSHRENILRQREEDQLRQREEDQLRREEELRTRIENLGSETETENEIDVISPVSSSTRPSPESENHHIQQILQPFKEEVSAGSPDYRSFLDEVTQFISQMENFHAEKKIKPDRESSQGTLENKEQIPSSLNNPDPELKPSQENKINEISEKHVQPKPHEISTLPPFFTPRPDSDGISFRPDPAPRALFSQPGDTEPWEKHPTFYSSPVSEVYASTGSFPSSTPPTSPDSSTPSPTRSSTLAPSPIPSPSPSPSASPSPSSISTLGPVSTIEDWFSLFPRFSTEPTFLRDREYQTPRQRSTTTPRPDVTPSPYPSFISSSPHSFISSPYPSFSSFPTQPSSSLQQQNSKPFKEVQRESKPFQPSRQEKSFNSGDLRTSSRSEESSHSIRQKDERLFHQWNSGARRTTPKPNPAPGGKENWWDGIPEIPGSDLLRHYSRTFENEISPVLASLNPAARTEEISQPRSDNVRPETRVLTPRIGSQLHTSHGASSDQYPERQTRPRAEIRSFPKPLYSGFVPVTSPPVLSGSPGPTPLSLFSSVPENIDEHAVFDLSRHVEFGTRIPSSRDHYDPPNPTPWSRSPQYHQNDVDPVSRRQGPPNISRQNLPRLQNQRQRQNDRPAPQPRQRRPAEPTAIDRAGSGDVRYVSFYSGGRGGKAWGYSYNLG